MLWQAYSYIYLQWQCMDIRGFFGARVTYMDVLEPDPVPVERY